MVHPSPIFQPENVSFPLIEGRNISSVHRKQVYAPTTNAEEVEVEQFCEDLQDLLERTPKKKCPFHHRRLECKSTKSRDTWRNRQVWPCSTE